MELVFLALGAQHSLLMLYYHFFLFCVFIYCCFVNVFSFAFLYVDYVPSCCRNWSRQMELQALACRLLPLNKINK